MKLNRDEFDVLIVTPDEKDNYPSNQINSVGFPEGQLLGNGASQEQCAEISAAYYQGEPLPKTGNEHLDGVIERIQENRDSK